MTNPGQNPNFDPFEQGDGVKAVSFKNAPHGSVITIDIDDDAKWLQTRDFKTGEPAYWDARPGEQPNPIMAAVVTGIVADTPWAVQSGQAGERRSVWATKPSKLFTAIQTAKREAGGGGSPLPILRGGKLDIAQTGEEPNLKNPNNENIKLYAARYTPPVAGYGQQDAFEGGQTFTGQAAAPAPAQPQYQQAPAQPQYQQAPVQQPAAAPFGQQAPAPQQFQQPQAPAAQGNPFGQQAPAPQQPAAAPFGQQAGPFGQQQAAPQQPAMAGAPASDPWGSAPQSDVPPF